MSTRILAAIYDDATAGRRVIQSALAERADGERGRWLEVPLGKSRWRATFPQLPQWNGSSWNRVVEDTGDELRDALARAAKSGAPSTFVLLAYEESAATSALWGIAGRELERSLDDAGIGRRVWLDDAGRRKRVQADTSIDDKQLMKGKRFDEDAYHAADAASRAPYCALAWFESATGLDRAALIDASYAADKGEDLAKLVTANRRIVPRNERALKLGLQAKGWYKRSNAIFAIQDDAPTGPLLNLLRGALSDKHPSVRSSAASVVQLLSSKKRSLPEAGPLLDALLAATKDADEDVARGAAASAGDLANWSDAILKRAHAALEKGESIGLHYVLYARSLPAEFAPLLMRLFERSKMLDERRLALRVLGVVRKSWKTILPLLTSLRDDPKLGDTAIIAIGTLDAPKHEKRQTTPIRFTDYKRLHVEVDSFLRQRVSSAELLRALDALIGKNEKARQARLEALYTIARDRNDPAAIGRMEEMLNDRSERVATGALNRLIWNAKKRPAAMEAVERATRHPLAAVSASATKYLSLLGRSVED